MEFTPIETQEQFDEAIKERLARAEKKYTEKYSGYLSPEDVTAQTEELTKKLEEMSTMLNDANEKATADAQAIADYEAKIKEYETASVKSRIANEVGISYELANRLSGETEEELRKDAEFFKSLTAHKSTAPLRNPESGDVKIDTRSQFADWAKSL